jgi:hypothetical protein
MTLMLSRKDAAFLIQPDIDRFCLLKRYILAGACFLAASLTGGLACSGQGEPHEPLSALEQKIRFGDDLSGAILSLEAILAREPRNSQAHYLLGLIFERSGFTDLANREYETADELDSGSALRVFGRKWDMSGQDAAMQFLRFMERRYGDDPAVPLMHAEAAARLGDARLAERCYRAAMKKYAGLAGVASSYGSFCLSRHRFDEAISLADYDLSLKKNHPAAALVKGEALIAQGKYLPALPLIRKVYDSSFNDLEKKKASELLLRLYMAQGMNKAALEPALFVLALEPDAAIDRQEKGLAGIAACLVRESRSGSLTFAVQLLRRQLKSRELELNLDLRLARLLEKNSNYALALCFFEEGAKLKASDPALEFQIARLRQINSDYEGSLRLLKSAEGSAPENRLIAASYKRLVLRMSNRRRDLAWKLKDLSKI